MSEKIFEAIENTRIALEENYKSKWTIGFSGGKDSTALLKVFLSAIKKARKLPKNISLIYCDTGVENPVIDMYVKELFEKLKSEFESQNVPIEPVILKAPVEHRFFVRVIGRGYPTPTNSFRWCTKGLRINPVKEFLSGHKRDDSIVSIGVRSAESEQRKRSIEKSGSGIWQSQREAKSSHRVFAPIIDFDLSDVWDAIFLLGAPNSIDARELEKIYTDASGECPIIKSPTSPPCASGRFGCWTCTVVRKDKSAQKMISAGHTELEPYLEFRNWISEFRNSKEMRWPVRRNGTNAPGPFSLKGRRIILERLFELEERVGKKILDREEHRKIEELWDLDSEQDHALENAIEL